MYWSTAVIDDGDTHRYEVSKEIHSERKSADGERSGV
jgi:hypothetical protein